MKAITIHQPFASAIAFNAKRYETRTWKTHFRGRIAISAGKRTIPEEFKQYFELDDYPMGCVICITEILDCIKMDKKLIDSIGDREFNLGDWEIGNYAWKLGKVELFKPIPVVGKQGLWDWDRKSIDDNSKK